MYHHSLLEFAIQDYGARVRRLDDMRFGNELFKIKWVDLGPLKCIPLSFYSIFKKMEWHPANTLLLLEVL